MKAFVTGATGFVGGHLVRALAARGARVVALTRRRETHGALTLLGCTPVAGSLEDDRSLAAALEGVEVIYHAAGLIAAKDEAEFFAVNEGGTRRLLDVARRAAPKLARFVYVSSQAALGPSPPGTPLPEDAECRPVTAYGRSKLAGETATRQSGLPWSIVRPPAVYGPGDRQFLKLFQLVRRGIAPLFGTGAQELSLVYVEDLARAIAQAGTHPAAGGGVFHAAHPELVLTRGLAKAVGASLGKDPIVIPIPVPVAYPIVSLVGWLATAIGRPSVLNRDKMAEFAAPSWLLDASKSERLLDWKASCDLAEGMRRTASWYRDMGWLR